MNFLKRNHFSMWFCILLALSLFGCGNKGDLYLPDDAGKEKTSDVKSEQKESNDNKEIKQDDN